jgi:cytoskeletal protein RodZ
VKHKIETSPIVLREKTLDLNVDHDHETPAAYIHKPKPFVLEKNGTLQIKLVLLSVMLVTVVWVGVLIVLGMEVIRRIYG